MLVLSRRKSEEIIITTPEGREIRVMLIDMRGDKARLGFDAPKDVTVHRLEIHEAIQRERSQNGQADAAEEEG